VRRALPLFDELWCKLDAGTEGHFQRVDGTRFPFRKILDNLLATARDRPIVIQSMFPSWEGRGPDDEEVGAFVERLREIALGGGRITLVQIYTVARPPADARIGALSEERLGRIADEVRAAGLAAEVYGGSA
jgi:wyosine [tRNA(Phe)-imidazoG37] synthetase (radical SAM superfamily)